MKIQCDVCEKAPATVICCADEAALCADCDVQVHAANKLASKHQRLLLQNLSSKLPRCDICQDKAAFIFCVEDRALFCRDCDQSIHVPGTLSADHHRLLATGIRVALGSPCCPAKDTIAPAEPPKKQPTALPVPPKQQPSSKLPPLHPAAKTMAFPHPQPQQQPYFGFSPSHTVPWADDDFLQLSDYECGDKRGSAIGLGELEWLADVGLFPEDDDDTLALAEVPELPVSSSSTCSFPRPVKSTTLHKKPRIEIDVDDMDFFTVPDLG